MLEFEPQPKNPGPSRLLMNLPTPCRLDHCLIEVIDDDAGGRTYRHLSGNAVGRLYLQVFDYPDGCVDLLMVWLTALHKRGGATSVPANPQDPRHTLAPDR